MGPIEIPIMCTSLVAHVNFVNKRTPYERVSVATSYKNKVVA